MKPVELTQILALLPEEARLSSIAYILDDVCPAVLDHPAYKEWRKRVIAAEMYQNALIDELERRQEYLPDHRQDEYEDYLLEALDDERHGLAC